MENSVWLVVVLFVFPQLDGVSLTGFVKARTLTIAVFVAMCLASPVVCCLTVAR